MDTPKEYTKTLDRASEVAEERRRKLTASCIKVYNYVESALDYIDDIEPEESILDEYDIYDPESYDWFNDLPSIAVEGLYNKYETLYSDTREVDEISDILDDAKYLLRRLYGKLQWVEGEK